MIMNARDGRPVQTWRKNQPTILIISKYYCWIPSYKLFLSLTCYCCRRLPAAICKTRRLRRRDLCGAVIKRTGPRGEDLHCARRATYVFFEGLAACVQHSKLLFLYLPIWNLHGHRHRKQGAEGAVPPQEIWPNTTKSKTNHILV